MRPLFASFGLPNGAGLSILLDDPFRGGSEERLRMLHGAVDEWEGSHAGVRVTRQLSAQPLDQMVRGSLVDYLYGDGAPNPGRLERHLGHLHEDGRLHRYAVRPGAPMEGRDLFARDAVLECILGAVRADRSVHLRAPRRYGKTSVLRRVERDLLASSRPAVHVDLSPGASATWLLVTLASEALDRVACATAVRRMSELAHWPAPGASPEARADARARLNERVERNPGRFGEQLVDALAADRVVLLLDEFSIFLRAASSSHLDEARSVVDLLRRARNASTPLVQVVAGSQGLTSFVEFTSDLHDGLDGLDGVDLGPLDDADGRLLTEELLYGEGLPPTEALLDAVLATVGAPVPYFLHVLVDGLAQEARPGRSLSPELVTEVYRDRILGPWANHVFRVYRLGSQPYPAELRATAAALLRLVASSAQGVHRAQLQAEFSARAPRDGTVNLDAVLACLREDYDLVEEAGCWRMRSKVLRERWSLAENWLTGHEV